MWKHLLVPIDFSDCAQRALELALDIASRDRASVTLMHVSSLPPNLPPEALVTPPGASSAMRIDEYTSRGVRARLEAIASPLRDREIDVRTVTVVAVSEDVADAILRAAGELDVNAIVVGTHGRTGLSHLLLGSVAEKVIRRANVPVITIRTASPEAELTREERFAEDEVAG